MTDLPLRCPKCGYSSGDTLIAIPHHTPRIERLLQSNERPTDDEEHRFQTFVIEAKSEIRCLKDRIKKTRDLLFHLQATLEKTRQAAKEHKEMLNPARQLPFDVLQGIFLHGAGMYTDAGFHFGSTSHSLDLTSPPWVYGRVCQSWKEVTLKTPLLWTRIKVVRKHITMHRKYTVSVPMTGRSTNFSRTPLSLSLLSLYLRRSGGLPLSVYLDGMGGDTTTDFGLAFFSLLFSHSSRWVSLFLAGVRPISPSSLNFSDDSFPLLNHIHFQETIWSASTTLIDIMAPILRSWTTVGPVSHLSPHLYSQITECSVSRVSLRETLKTIQQLPNLCRLTVGEMKKEALALPVGVVDDESPFLLASLSHLILEHCSDSNPQSFIDSISCPALTSLSVTTQFSVTEPIQRLEVRSDFTLECMNITAQGSLAMLENTTGIKRLVVRAIGKTADYEPFISLQDVLSHLGVVSEHVLESEQSENSSSASAGFYLPSWAANNFSDLQSSPTEIFIDEDGDSQSSGTGGSQIEDSATMHPAEATIASEPELEESEIAPTIIDSHSESSSPAAAETPAIADDPYNSILTAPIPESSPSPGPQTESRDLSSVIPFPNLRRLELEMCSSPVLEDSDIMAQLLACVVSRNTSSGEGGRISVVLDEIFISSPDHMARKMLDHAGLKELRSIGIKVDIVGL